MGRIQSIHSFSTVDGPGTRCVVFLQGCPMGCIFCHNPDSWDLQGGEEISVETLMQRIERFRPFLQTPGLTISGGEPLMQPEFTFNLMRDAHRKRWHVALDTSGWGPAERFVQLASQADLVMFSIKHAIHPEHLVRCDYGQILDNWRRLAQIPVPVWLRYVLINDRTDDAEGLRALGALAKENPNVERLEILPYNSLAAGKWNKMGWDYPFRSGKTPSVTEEQIQQAEQLVSWEKKVK
jgi:pyruvate formate lyase activating enzyme